MTGQRPRPAFRRSVAAAGIFLFLGLLPGGAARADCVDDGAGTLTCTGADLPELQGPYDHLIVNSFTGNVGIATGGAVRLERSASIATDGSSSGFTCSSPGQCSIVPGSPGPPEVAPTQMDWQPSEQSIAAASERLARRELNPPTHCSACHR